MRTHFQLPLLGALAVFALTTGCGATDNSSTRTDVASPTEMTTAASADDSADGSAGAGTQPDPTPAATAAPVAPFVEGIPLLVLLAPGELTNELAPEFSWQPVDDAATYRLAVIGEQGPMWSWEGSQTAVRLGGFSEERSAGFPGPTINGSVTWSVVALAGDGTVVAASELRSLAAG